MVEGAEILGYIAMVGLGIVLGLLGAGGSILTVPVLVYLLAVPASQATGYSLIVVGTSALVASIAYLRRKQSNPRMGLIFGAPAILGVYIMRRYIFPAIPETVLQIEGFVLSKDVLVMVVFAIFMLLASIAMIRGKKEASGDGTLKEAKINYPVMLSAGFMVGMFTGFVGAGGGFMILPFLVIMGGLPIKVAIGTDLLIIAAKSLVGFIGEMQVSNSIDFGFIGLVILLPLAGIILGAYLNKHAPANKLKAGFGWFVLVMGIYIIAREFVLV
mgnify:CR=1 FL=1